ncbi:MAG: class I SAM-dependent methyltransferase [Oceanicaulis sp.]
MKNDPNFWDRIAAKYAAEPIKDEAAYERKLALTQAAFPPQAEVLEIGCGTGSTALRHAPHVKSVLATDLSERMIEIAWSRAEEAGVANVHFEVADFDLMEVETGRYDAVLMLSVLHLLRDRRAALAKAYGALKPGGVLASSTACLGDTMAYMAPVLPVMRLVGAAPWAAVFTETRLMDEIEAAGFDIERRYRPAKAAAAFHIARKPAG